MYVNRLDKIIEELYIYFFFVIDTNENEISKLLKEYEYEKIDIQELTSYNIKFGIQNTISLFNIVEI